MLYVDGAGARGVRGGRGEEGGEMKEDSLGVKRVPGGAEVGRPLSRVFWKWLLYMILCHK